LNKESKEKTNDRILKSRESPRHSIVGGRKYKRKKRGKKKLKNLGFSLEQA